MKKCWIFLCLIISSLTLSAQTSYSRFDVNNDHEVNVTDVTKLVNIILGTEKSTLGDVNGDEAVNVNDVTALVDYILGKRMINGHEFVDLGLPSGTLWAAQNMGADTPEQAGEYYAWGEKEVKTVYNWANYAFCNGTSTSLNRYNTDPAYGAVDNQVELLQADDVANVLWGGLWRMPTIEQAQELKSKCKWALDTARGGFVVTGPNGNTIFMPMAGYIKGSTKLAVGITGYYWITSISTDYPYNVACLVCEKSSFNLEVPRCYGRTIRPVAK